MAESEKSKKNKFPEDPIVYKSREAFYDKYIDSRNREELAALLDMDRAEDYVERKSWRDMDKAEFKRFLNEVHMQHPMLNVNPVLGAGYPIGYKFVTIAGAGGSGSSIYLGIRSLKNLDQNLESLKDMVRRKNLDISALHPNQLRYLEQAARDKATAEELYDYLKSLPIERKLVAAKVLAEDDPSAQEDAGPDTLAGASFFNPTLDDVPEEKVDRLQNGKLSQQEMVWERFRREAQILRNLRHPHIVDVYHSGTAGRKVGGDIRRMYFYTMEFLPNGSDRGMIPVPDAVDLAVKVGNGLAAMHEAGIIHRDVKPQNVMYDVHGVPKVTDPGIAKRSGSQYDQSNLSLTEDGQVMGTPNFMPPEQIRNSKHIDVRADIYSLGVTMFWWMTGRFPYNFRSDSGVQGILVEILRGKQIPLKKFLDSRNRALESAVAKAIQKDPDRRFQSMSAFVGALKAISR